MLVWRFALNKDAYVSQVLQLRIYGMDSIMYRSLYVVWGFIFKNGFSKNMV